MRRLEGLHSMWGGRARDTRLARPGRRALVVCAHLRPGRDKRRTRWRPIYRSPAASISPYAVDHSLLAKSGIDPFFHLMERSCGCRFKCNFCVNPAEVGTHADRCERPPGRLAPALNSGRRGAAYRTVSVAR